jgi:integrase
MIRSVFRQRRRIDGQLVVADSWSGRLRMPWETKVSTVALNTPDKRIALHKLGQIADEREKEHNGLIAPKPAREAAERLLPELLADYLAELEVRGRRPRTLRKYRLSLLKLFRRCRWEKIQDVTQRSFCLFRSQAGLSGKTSNDLLAGARAFFVWLERQRMILADPLKYVERVDTRGKTQFRRALTEDEMRRLLAVAPPFRAVVYLTALFTGLRRSELNQLRWGDLHLDDPQPFVLAPASITKNKKDAKLPLRAEVVSALRSIRPADAAPFAWVFHGKVPRVKTLQSDLKLAEIKFTDDSGRRLDFHALRATFCTMLAVNRVPLNEAMQLMRHSDPKLTMKVYTDTAQLELSGTVASLPSISLPPRAINS